MADLQPETKLESSSSTNSQQSEAIQAKDLMAALPTKEGWSTPFLLYRNCWIRPEFLEETMAVQDKFVPRPDDIILATHPKCGTTWLKALVFAIVNRSRYPLAGASADEHPLLTLNPHSAVPFFGMSPGGLDAAEAQPSPRLLSTHLPLPLLPPAVSAVGCRIVCLCREPKDAFVSLWHFQKKFGQQGFCPAIEDMLAMFLSGCSVFGPFWDRYLEYWNESLARPREVMFLRYEEMVAEPLETVLKLATFLGVPFTESEERGGAAAEQVVRLCSFKSLSGLDVNRRAVTLGEKTPFNNSWHFREGKVGDWVNHMSKEMAEEMDRIVEDKFKGSGLVF